MVVIWPLPTQVASVLPLTNIAFKNYELLTQQIHTLVTIPPGPYALFHHKSHLYERMRDSRVLILRLSENRKLLTELTYKEEALRPKKYKYKKTLSKKLQAVVQKSNEVHHQMKMDMESFYIFGNLLLDQWAYVIGYLVGDKEAHLFNFVKLESKVRQKGNRGLLEALCNKHQNDIIWLHYQLRQYRNVFVEHVNAPWQRGTSRSTYGNDFRLASPSAVGWVSEDDIEKEIRAIENLAPIWARSPYHTWNKASIRQLLEIAFYHIDTIKKHEFRERVWKVWEKVGGWTPSYDITATRLMHFIGESMLTAIDIISTHPDKINVGAAPKSQAKEA